MGGGRSKCTCGYDGEGGSNVCHFGAYVLIKYPHWEGVKFTLSTSSEGGEKILAGDAMKISLEYENASFVRTVSA